MAKGEDMLVNSGKDINQAGEYSAIFRLWIREIFQVQRETQKSIHDECQGRHNKQSPTKIESTTEFPQRAIAYDHDVCVLVDKSASNTVKAIRILN